MSSYNFVQEITAQMGVWSSPLHRVVQVKSNKIYFVIFGYSYMFLRILEICTIFWELNQLKNDLKIVAQCWAVIGHGYSACSAACHVRPAGRPARPRPGGPRASRAGRVVTWSPHAVHAWDDAVAGSPAAQWRLAGGKVLG
jgi:hypothetical protein